MAAGRLISRNLRTIVTRSLIFRDKNNFIPIIKRNYFHSLHDLHNTKVVTGQAKLQSPVLNPYTLQRFGLSSNASPESNEDGISQKAEETADIANDTEESPDAGNSDKTVSSSDEEELSMEDMVKLVAEKDKLLKAKHDEIAKIKDNVLRTYADMENVMGRTKREAENSKKYAIQIFAKSLLDVADNLGRASSVVKESYDKIDTSEDGAGAVPLLKTLLEGVEMTEKQLAEVFKKFGVEKYDPTDEQFDPNRHNAVFQVPDATKPPDTVAVVLKAGYMLHDRILRPAEVGVTITEEEKDASRESET
uniref:grpE protein homolog 2, mitochondrial-like isoform X2 n=1 Tax=Erigeron canadensis TaxID=72917 RepID=UPI001CB9084E|nr:grpE protein homolog 2, mitochondrial-like isoform X2 [Erigeron canadensis]